MAWKTCRSGKDNDLRLTGALGSLSVEADVVNDMFGFVINDVSGVVVLTFDDVVINGNAGVIEIGICTRGLHDTFTLDFEIVEADVGDNFCSDVVARETSIDDFGDNFCVADSIGKVIIPFGSRIRSTCWSLRCMYSPLISRMILNFWFNML